MWNREDCKEHVKVKFNLLPSVGFNLQKVLYFVFQLTENPCNNTNDIFFLLYHGYF